MSSHPAPFLRRSPPTPTSISYPLPHLSFSQIDRYERCPRSFFHHYVEGLRPKQSSASLVFGSAIHETLSAHFSTGEDPEAFFSVEWDLHAEDDLQYSGRDSWESLRVKGLGLMAEFLRSIRERITKVVGIEARFEVKISSLPVPVIGIVDIIAEVDGVLTVTDWKTSGSSYAEHEVHLSDQLTCYTLGRPEIPDVAFGVFVKTKEPKIELHRSRRTGADVGAFLRKAESVVSDVSAGRFDKRPGDHCGYCDFLPLCLGRTAEANSTLHVPPRS